MASFVLPLSHRGPLKKTVQFCETLASTTKVFILLLLFQIIPKKNEDLACLVLFLFVNRGDTIFFTVSSKLSYASRGWVPKFATGLIHQIRHSSKIMKVIKLSFGQNDPPMRELFWQNNSLVTHILFELCSIWYISPVANFGTHPLAYWS